MLLLKLGLVLGSVTLVIGHVLYTSVFGRTVVWEARALSTSL